MSTSPLQGLPIPNLGDPADMAASMSPVVGAIEKQVVMYFATTTLRNSTVTSPLRGMMAWCDDVAAFTFYTGSVWKVLGVTTAGTIALTIGATADVGWILLNGGTTVNAQTLYPELWARLPASWQSGSSMVTADWRGRTAVGAGTGAGLTARTLGVANIGEENHTLLAAESGEAGHTPTMASMGGVSANHFHNLNGITDNDSPDHGHQAPPNSGTTAFVVNGTGNLGSANIGAGTGYALNSVTGGANARHQHTINQNTGGVSSDHNHGVTMNAVAAANAAAGHNNMQPSAVANWQIKAH